MKYRKVMISGKIYLQLFIANIILIFSIEVQFKMM